MIRAAFHAVQSDRLFKLLAGGSSSSFLVNIGGVFTSLLLQLFLTNTLGASAYGTYLYLITCIVLLAMLARFGLHVVNTRFIPHYTTGESWDLIGGLMSFSRKLSFLGGLILAFLIVGLLLFTLPQGDARMPAYFYAAAILPFYALLGIEQSYLRAFKNAARSIVPDSIVRPLIILFLGVVMVYGFGLSLDVTDALILTACAILAGLFLCWYWLHAQTPQEVRKIKRSYDAKKWFKSGMAMFLITVATTAFNQIDIIMVGSLSDSQSTAYYGVAAKVANLLAFVLVAVNTILAPMASELHSTGDKAPLQKLIRQAAFCSFSFTVLGALVLIFAGRWGLSLFGTGFDAGYEPLMILVMGQLFNTACGSVGVLMTMTGHEKKAAQVMAVTLGLNIALNAAFIPLYGNMGAAFATAVSMVVWNIILMLYCLKHIQINTSIFPVGTRYGQT